MPPCGDDLHPPAWGPSGVARLPWRSTLPESSRPGCRLCSARRGKSHRAPGCCRWRQLEGVQALFRLQCVSKPGGWAASGVRSGSPRPQLRAGGGGAWAKAVHGARPTSRSIDLIAARVVMAACNGAISRRLDALQPVVVSFRADRGGKPSHVMADSRAPARTVRAVRHHRARQLPGWIEDTVQASCPRQRRLAQMVR